MLSIVLSPDPNMQAKRKSMQQDLDLENGYNILETKKPKLKGAKYMRVLCKEAYSTEETTGTVLVILWISAVMINFQVWTTRKCFFDIK